MKHFPIAILIICLVINKLKAELKVTKTDMRPPLPNDIGIFFDVGVVNTADNVKQSFNYRIKSEKCCLQLDSEEFCNVGQLVGGFFGQIDPAEMQTVSLVWPTISVYNRVGFCQFWIISINSTDGRSQQSHRAAFNTSFSAGHVPHVMSAYVMGRNFSDCGSPDQNPFSGCSPVNCEEKYFGQRSFFNCDRQVCEAVPPCDGPDVIYDFLINECVNTKSLLTQDDVNSFRNGSIEVKEWTLKRNSRFDEPISPNENGFVDFSTTETDPASALPTQTTLLEGFLHGSLIILATLSVYFLVCFCIFLTIAWISKRTVTTGEAHPIYAAQKTYHSPSPAPSSNF